MRAAIEAFDAGADVALDLEAPPDPQPLGRGRGRDQRGARQRRPRTTPRLHAFDTVKGSDFLADQDAVEIFAREAPDDIYELEHWGAVFSRTEDGRLAQRPFGAAGVAAHRRSPPTSPGHVLIQVLYEQLVKRDIRVYEEFFAWKLVEDGGRCVGRDRLGPAARRAEGDRRRSRRSSPPAAPGGSTGSRRTPTPAPATGWRWRCGSGVPLKDMEFMQFHPTTLVPDRDPDDRGLPRRGRVPAQQGRRALHEALRAERARARLARRRSRAPSRPRSTRAAASTAT